MIPNGNLEYGNPYDIMGEGKNYHNISMQKERLGWLNPDSETHKIITVMEDTSEPIYLEPIEKQDGKIPSHPISQGAGRRVFRYVY